VNGTCTLGTWSNAIVKASELTLYPCLMSFTIKGVPAEQRYSLTINGVPGKIFVTKVNKLVTLTVTSCQGAGRQGSPACRCAAFGAIPARKAERARPPKRC
jgi:hypothetical protein